MNEIDRYWKQLEAAGEPPMYARGILEVDFDELDSRLAANDRPFWQANIDALYDGDVMLIKRAFDPEFVEKLKTNVRQFWRKNPDSFYKMKDNCPDFHRVIDEELSTKYAVHAVKHSAYFFPWNEDPCEIRDEVMSRWSVIKEQIGIGRHGFEGSLPSDGAVDRIQVCMYPPRIGRLATHTDPYHNQRTIISGFLSRRGAGEYNTGGFYVVNQNREKVDVEPKIEVGDMAIAYATIKHGVTPIDADYQGPIDWYEGEGRWFLGLYTNDSDEKKGRRLTGISYHDADDSKPVPVSVS